MNYKQMLDKLAELEQRIAKLETTPRNWDDVLFPNTWNKGCTVCGLGADGAAMGYVCTNPKCPTAITCNNYQDAFK